MSTESIPTADAPPDTKTFQQKLEQLINRYSKENGSNTPDFILAEFLNDSLTAFDKAVKRRSEWYGHGAKQVQAEEGNAVGSVGSERDTIPNIIIKVAKTVRHHGLIAEADALVGVAVCINDAVKPVVGG